jgi:V8-like Glu-specific endopeptidase
MKNAMNIAGVVLTTTIALPAHAIVGYSGSVSGTGFGLLDGEAKLILDTSSGTFGCTGNLLAGGSYLLTAAHCLTGDTGTDTTSHIAISFKSGAVTASSSTYYVAPTWNGTIGAGDDLALIELQNPITSISGYQLYTGTTQSALGQTVLIAGYGQTGSGASGATGSFGTLNYGYNTYDETGTIAGMSSSVFLYDFDNGTAADNLMGASAPVQTNGVFTEAIIAPGDSGGASLIANNGAWYLIGIHDFGGCVGSSCTPDSRFGSFAGDTSVLGQTWLNSHLVSAVPEPTSTLMFSSGLFALAFFARNRKRTDHSGAQTPSVPA